LLWQISKQNKRILTRTGVLRLAALVLVVLSFVVIHAFDVGQVGDSLEWKDGKTRVSAGSNPVILVWDALAISLFVTLMLRKSNTTVTGVPSRGHRILAFSIDFWFSLLAISGVGALVPLLLEAARTGRFSWHFQRDYAVSSDGQIALPSAIAFLALIALYFVFPLTRGKQTVGGFIMGLKVTPPFGDGGRFTFRQAVRRTYYEFNGLSPFLWLSKDWDKDGQGRTWYDIKSNCTVVLVGENSEPTSAE
jgi:hypothetical protein